MSLQDWLQIGHLSKHEATVTEVRNLLGVVDRELADAGVVGVSDAGRFRNAYEGALILCKLALHVSGFEVQNRVPEHHPYWINSLEFTLGAEYKSAAIHLSKCSKLWHTALYDHAGVVEKQDADDRFEAARELRAAVRDWLRIQHPDLLPSA